MALMRALQIVFWIYVFLFIDIQGGFAVLSTNEAITRIFILAFSDRS